MTDDELVRRLVSLEPDLTAEECAEVMAWVDLGKSGERTKAGNFLTTMERAHAEAILELVTR